MSTTEASPDEVGSAESKTAGANTAPGANLRVSVETTVSRLQRDLLDGSATQYSSARATLANLRQKVGKPIEKDPLALETVLMTLVPPLREEELGKGDTPSPSEQAAYHALTLFASHFQGATAPVHVPNCSFALACGKLNASSESKSFKARFDAMMMVRSSTSRLVHLRSLVSLLRGAGIGFDYGQFACDLRALGKPRYRNSVLLRWGRDFVRALNSRP